MRLKSLLLTLLAVLGIAGSASAQNIKIGFVNVEAILVFMPETQTMNQQLQTYQTKLAQSLEAKQAYLETKLREYEEFAATTQDEAQLKPKRDELIKLQQEIQASASDADQKLGARRGELMQPIVDKIQNEIDLIAKEEGWTFIFNTVDGSGVSIVLHAPEENDLTRKLATRLGIKLESETPAATPAAPGNN
ncbi:MAG: OmpH family outer membrane protein [Bacteroidia bacterium]|nr:OmpH family outer membrane protein [Bacteroidia bacterium]